MRSSSLLSEWSAARRLLLWPPLWIGLVASLLGFIVAYQVPHSYLVDIGSPQDQAYVRNFHTRLEEGGRSYRWSDVYGYVSFPGLGGARAFTASLELDPSRAAPVSIFINGQSLFSDTLQPGWQMITLRVDSTHPRAFQSRDTVMEVRAPDFRTEDQPTEPKGVKLDYVRVEQAAAGGIIVPAYSTLLLLGGAVALIYLLVGRSLEGLATLRRARAWGLIVAASCGFTMVLWLAQSHVVPSVASAHLVVTAATMLTLLVVVELALRRVAALTMLQSRLLALCVVLAFGVRYGGMALPQSVIVDMPWHMKWLRTLLSGDWQSLYFPGGLSSVPSEWGLDLLIPKSPLFYFASSPLGLLPFDLETLVKWLICLLDATLVLAVFWLVLRLGGSKRAALPGAALYAFMPLAFRAFAYGILPTIFAQWLAVWLFIVLLATRTSSRPLVWTGITLLAALTLLAFPTVALFVTLVLLGWTLVLWLDREPATNSTWRISVMLVAAWLLAIMAYYGLYISPVLASAAALLAPKEGGSMVRWPGGSLQLLSWSGDYIVTVLPALLAIIGVGLLVAVRPERTAPGTRDSTLWLIIVWLAIGPLFLVANYKVDMIGKHLFFVMAPAAVTGGLALWSLARRGRWAAMLAALAIGTVIWQGLIFWVDRLVRAST